MKRKTYSNKYIPKKKVFTEKRIEKIIKDIIEACEADREKALEAFARFLTLDQESLTTVNEDGVIVGRDYAKSILDSLRLAQDASDNKVKLLELAIKLTITESKGKPGEVTKTPFGMLSEKSTNETTQESYEE